MVCYILVYTFINTTHGMLHSCVYRYKHYSYTGISPMHVISGSTLLGRECLPEAAVAVIGLYHSTSILLDTLSLYTCSTPTQTTSSANDFLSLECIPQDAFLK